MSGKPSTRKPNKAASQYHRKHAFVSDKMTLAFYRDKHTNPTYVEFIETPNHVEEVTRFYWEDPSEPFVYCWMLRGQRNKIASLPMQDEIITLQSPVDATYDSKNNIALGPKTRYFVSAAQTNANFTVTKLTLHKIL